MLNEDQQKEKWIDLINQTIDDAELPTLFIGKITDANFTNDQGEYNDIYSVFSKFMMYITLEGLNYYFNWWGCYTHTINFTDEIFEKDPQVWEMN